MCSSELFSVMATAWNIHGVGSYKFNRKVFCSDLLKLYNYCERGDFLYCVFMRIWMVIIWWKVSKDIQTVIAVMNKGANIDHYL